MNRMGDRQQTGKAPLRAFTLIELLAVIAIILLLASLLAPTLGRMKSAANRTVCMSNVSQLMQAHAWYLSDNNGLYLDYNVGLLFFNYLSPYHGKTQDIRLCPEAPAPAPGGGKGSASTAYTWGGGVVGSYGINGFCYGIQPSVTGGSGEGGKRNPMGEGNPANYVYDEMWYKSLGNTKEPSRVPMFMDAMWPDGWPVHQSFAGMSTFDIDTPTQAGPWYIQRFLLNRHNRRTSYSFVDGSARSVPLNEAWTLQWNTLFVTQGVHSAAELMPL